MVIRRFYALGHVLTDLFCGVCRSWPTPRWRPLGKVTLVGVCWATLGAPSSRRRRSIQTFVHVVQAAVMLRDLIPDQSWRLCSRFVLQCFSINVEIVFCGTIIVKITTISA